MLISKEYILEDDPEKIAAVLIRRDTPFYDILIDMEKPEAIEIIGNVGTGKSALVALLGEMFYRKGLLVYDLLASDSDHENFNWLVPGKQGVRYPILLVHSSYSDVFIPKHLEGWVKEVTDEHELYELARICVEEKRVFVFDNASYDPAHYRAILLKWFSEIIQVHRKIFTEYGIRGAVLLREMYKLLPSQGGSKIAKEGGLLKEVVKTMFRERRRGPLFFIGDIQRDIELDKGIRSMMTTRIIRRAPDRMLEQDVQEINTRVEEYYKRLESQGGFVNAAIKSYPRIDALTNQQCYVMRGNGDIAFCNHIPLPNHGYIDAFREDIEARIGLRVKVDTGTMKEFFNVKGKRVDHNFWMDRLKLQFIDSNRPKTAATLMVGVEWESHTGEGLPPFLSLLEVLLRGGFLIKRGDARRGIPVCYRLAGEDDIEENEDDVKEPVSFTHAKPPTVIKLVQDKGGRPLTIDAIDREIALYMAANEANKRPNPITSRYLCEVGKATGRWTLSHVSIHGRLNKWRNLGLLKEVKTNVKVKLIRTAWIKHGLFEELLEKQTSQDLTPTAP